LGQGELKGKRKDQRESCYWKVTQQHSATQRRNVIERSFAAQQHSSPQLSTAASAVPIKKEVVNSVIKRYRKHHSVNKQHAASIERKHQEVNSRNSKAQQHRVPTETAAHSGGRQRGQWEDPCKTQTDQQRGSARHGPPRQSEAKNSNTGKQYTALINTVPANSISTTITTAAVPQHGKHSNHKLTRTISSRIAEK
jgi:hypothetical protein